MCPPSRDLNGLHKMSIMLHHHSIYCFKILNFPTRRRESKIQVFCWRRKALQSPCSASLTAGTISDFILDFPTRSLAPTYVKFSYKTLLCSLESASGFVFVMSPQRSLPGTLPPGIQAISSRNILPKTHDIIYALVTWSSPVRSSTHLFTYAFSLFLLKYNYLVGRNPTYESLLGQLEHHREQSCQDNFTEWMVLVFIRIKELRLL